MAKDNDKKTGSEERLDRILTLELARVTEAAAVAAARLRGHGAAGP